MATPVLLLPITNKGAVGHDRQVRHTDAFVHNNPADSGRIQNQIVGTALSNFGCAVTTEDVAACPAEYVPFCKFM
jgi:hypothetical protein